MEKEIGPILLTRDEFNRLKLNSSAQQNDGKSLVAVYWVNVHKEVVNKVEKSLFSADAVRCLIPCVNEIIRKDYESRNQEIYTLDGYLVYVGSEQPDWSYSQTPLYVTEKDLSDYITEKIFGPLIELKYSKNIKKVNLTIKIIKEYLKPNVLKNITLPIVSTLKTIAYCAMPNVNLVDLQKTETYKVLKNKLYSEAYPAFNWSFTTTFQDLIDSYCENHDGGTIYKVMGGERPDLTFDIKESDTDYIINVTSDIIEDKGEEHYLIWPNMELVDIPTIFKKYGISVIDNSEYYEKM